MGRLATYITVDTINSSATKLFKDVFKFIYFKKFSFPGHQPGIFATTKNVRTLNYSIHVYQCLNSVVYP